MMTPDFIQILTGLRIRFQLADGNLKIDAPKGILTTDLLEELKERKQDLIEFLRNNQERLKYLSIKSTERKEYYPVTSAQKRLYVLQQMGPDNVVYNLPQYIHLGVGIDRQKLEATFNALIRRHESFRTSFEMVNETLYQRIHEDVEFSIDCIEAEAPDARQIFKEFVVPFDLSAAPLLRVGLLKVAQHHVLMVDVHHIIADGISIDILKKEFGLLYRGAALNPLRLRYRDYSQWQHREVQQAAIKTQAQYWVEEFSGKVAVLDLPTDYSRPPVQDFSGQHIHFIVGKPETDGVKNLGKREETTLYMTLFCVFLVLLWRLSGQEDIVIGTPTAGRRHADVENIVGMFVNTLAIRNYPTGDQRFVSFLQEVKVRFLSAFENQEYPFEDLVERVDVARDASRNPLFDVMFILQNQGEYGGEIPDIADDRVVHGREGMSKFDLSLTVVEVGEKLSCDIEYCRRLFDPGTIERFIGYFRRIVSAVVNRRKMLLKEIEILSDEEKQQVVYGFNDTGGEYPADKRLEQLFVRQAERTPLHIAVVCKDKELTYRELHSRSSQLAAVLREKGVRGNTIIGIMLEPSIELIIGILGILKSGGAYLPIDVGYPEKRKRYMLEDSRSEYLLAGQSNYGELDSIVEVIDPGDSDWWRRRGCGEIMGKCVETGNVGCVIYTSGTTGKPNGVILNHMGMVNQVFTKLRELEIEPADILSQSLSIGFVASIWQFFAPLFCGARLNIYSRNVTADPYELFKNVEKDLVSVVEVVPSLLNIYLELLEAGKDVLELRTVRVLALTGERVTPLLVNRFYKIYRINLVNAYGQSECSDDTLHYKIPPSNKTVVVPIGRPANNTQVYILGKEGLAQPLGIRGELYIGGDGLAAGYLNRPPLISEKFIPNPFIREKKTYKTGDLARWLPDGNVEFMGRVDNQVKIRGFRIEPGEIEGRLLNHPEIKEAVVVIKTNKKGDNHLCSYFSSDREIAVSELRRYLAVDLPDYMIPSYFVRLESIPKTPNGKIDRKGLPEPGVKKGEGYLAPRHNVEKRLVDIWSEVLAVEKDAIGIHDNFFELGGHSLRAIRVVARANQADFTISIMDIFKFQTIAELADFIILKQGNKVLIGRGDESSAEDVSRLNANFNPDIYPSYYPCVIGTIREKFKYELQHDIDKGIFFTAEGGALPNLGYKCDTCMRDKLDYLHFPYERFADFGSLEHMIGYSINRKHFSSLQEELEYCNERVSRRELVILTGTTYFFNYTSSYKTDRAQWLAIMDGIFRNSENWDDVRPLAHVFLLVDIIKNGYIIWDSTYSYYGKISPEDFHNAIKGNSAIEVSRGHVSYNAYIPYEILELDTKHFKRPDNEELVLKILKKTVMELLKSRKIKYRREDGKYVAFLGLGAVKELARIAKAELRGENDLNALCHYATEIFNAWKYKYIFMRDLLQDFSKYFALPGEIIIDMESYIENWDRLHRELVDNKGDKGRLGPLLKACARELDGIVKEHTKYFAKIEGQLALVQRQ